MKILKRILIIVICLVLLGYLAYKIAYPYVAPMVFDYVVEHHMDAFIKLEQSLSESLGEMDSMEPGTQNEGEKPSVEEAKNPSDEISNQEGDAPEADSKTPSDKKASTGTSSDNKTPTTGETKPSDATEDTTQKPNTDIQSVKTTMGVFSGEHLARALKNMTPQDKTRIIALCQSAVSTSDILKVTKMMMQDGLTKEQQKYIENYLRDNLSVPHKREILEILQKY